MPRAFKRSKDRRDRTAPWLVTWADRVQLPDGSWRRHERTFTATPDKAESLALGAAREEDARRRTLGLPPLHPTATPSPDQISLPRAIDAWIASLAGNAPGYVRESRRIIQAATAGLEHTGALRAQHLLDHLTALRARGLSPRSIHKHWSRARSFSRFLDQVLHAVTRDPWSPVTVAAARASARGKAAKDPQSQDRYRRRDLTPEECERLLAAVKDPEAPTWRSSSRTRKDGTPWRRRPGDHPYVLTPRDRELIYRLAIEAGLRAGDIRALCPEHLKRRAGSSHLDLAAGTQKSGRRTLLPIPEPLARDLAAIAMDRPIGRPIWRLPDTLAPVLRLDCARCSPPIPTHHPDDPAPGSPEARPPAASKRARPLIRDVVDFHSLRHSFITGAALTPGVTPRHLKDLARHASIQTTMEVYAHLSSAETAEAMRLVSAQRSAQR